MQCGGKWGSSWGYYCSIF